MSAFDLGELIKNLRKSKKLTQAQVAKRIGVSVTTIKSYESNLSQPLYENLRKLALLFGVTSDALMGLNYGLVIDCEGLTPSQIEIVSDSANRVANEFRELNKQGNDRP